MCLTTTFIIAILGMIAALKYRIITLCPTKAPRFPADNDHFVEEAENDSDEIQHDFEIVQQDQAKTD